VSEPNTQDCAICGASFIRYHRTLTCSEPCRQQHKRNYGYEYYNEKKHDPIFKEKQIEKQRKPAYRKRKNALRREQRRDPNSQLSIYQREYNHTRREQRLDPNSKASIYERNRRDRQHKNQAEYRARNRAILQAVRELGLLDGVKWEDLIKAKDPA
jgi:hypothetical protein